MHESVGTPSICTVHAPQWPSLHAIFVPVRPSSSRSTCASDDPTRTPRVAYLWPFTVSSRSMSLTARHRQDVREVDEPRARARDEPCVVVVLRLGQRAPEIARSGQQLTNLVELLRVAVALVRRVEREPECAERV